MIYTVTFNPSVDYVVCTEALRIGCVNRAAKEEVYFGGKGINVSCILNRLGIPSVALGFVAGFTGDALCDALVQEGIRTDFVRLKTGFTRINIKMKSGQETELNGSGPIVDEEAAAQLMRKLKSLRRDDTVVLAGSVPRGLPMDIYERLLAVLQQKRIRAVVDIGGDSLLRVVPYAPFLIKPNHHELGEAFGVTIKERDEAVFYAKELKKMGAVNVLVSMAERGAVLVDAYGEVHVRPAYRGEAKNSVGAGDSMVAGFLAGLINGDYAHALELGMAAGAATAFADGLATKDEIFDLLTRGDVRNDQER